MESSEDHTGEGDELCTERNVGEGAEADEDPDESLTNGEAGEEG